MFIKAPFLRCFFVGFSFPGSTGELISSGSASRFLQQIAINGLSRTNLTAPVMERSNYSDE